VATPLGLGGVTATWVDNATTESGYEVEYEKNDSGTWVAFTSSPYAANTITADQGSTSGNWEKIRVRVKATIGGNWVISAAIYKLIAPTSVVVTAAAGSPISATWNDNSSYEDGYEIQYQIDGAGWNTHTNSATGANSTSSGDGTNPTLDGGEFVEVRVRSTLAGQTSSSWAIGSDTA